MTRHLEQQGGLLPQVAASSHVVVDLQWLAAWCRRACPQLSAATPQDVFALQGRHQSEAQAGSTAAGTEQQPGTRTASVDRGPAEQSSQQPQSHAPDSATDASRDHSGTETWSGSSSYSEAGSQGNSHSDSGDDGGEEEGAGRPGSQEGAERGLVGAMAGAGGQQGGSAGRRALQLRLQGLALDNVDAVEPMKLMLQVGCSEGQVLALSHN